VPAEAIKKVSFGDVDNINNVVETAPKSEIAKEYEKLLGKTPKFIDSNSPIDRYYKMYVVEPESKVWGGMGGGNTKMRHLRGCPNGIS
jgi:hypothetical protein